MMTDMPPNAAKAGLVRDARGGAATGALVSLDRALARLCAVRPAGPRWLAPHEAVGLILAEPLIAAAPIPAHAIALREGYAVNAADLVGASPYSPASLSTVPQRMSAGQALPAGADAILPLEAVTLDAGRAEATQAVPPGREVRRAGDDARPGTILRGAGRMFRPLDAAIARASATRDVAVRRVRLAIVESDPDISSAGAFIAAFATLRGAVASTGSDPRPNEADIAVAVADDPPGFLTNSDEIVAPGLAIRPGERIVCALRGGLPLLVVPPRLDAALAACLLVLRPCLARLTGAAAPTPAVEGWLTRKVSSAPGLTDLVLLGRTADGGLEPLASGSPSFAAMAGAEAWLAIPPDSEGLPEGSPVTAFSLAEILT